MNRFTFPDWGLFAGLFHTLLPDFMLAFTFFTALIYAVLGKRFDRGRTAAAMAIALGLALSTGLVWWESQHGYSIRDLGPVAIIFAVIMLALVLFQAIRHQGGSFAGVAIALAICLLILWVLGLGLPAPAETVGSVFLLALVFGIIAFLIHHHRYCRQRRLPSTPGLTACPFQTAPSRRHPLVQSNDQCIVTSKRLTQTDGSVAGSGVT